MSKSKKIIDTLNKEQKRNEIVKKKDSKSDSKNIVQKMSKSKKIIDVKLENNKSEEEVIINESGYDLDTLNKEQKRNEIVKKKDSKSDSKNIVQSFANLSKNSLPNDFKVKGKKFLAFAGYLFYIWDKENLNIKLFPLPYIQPTCRLRSTSEVFKLDRPSFYLDGKPAFIVIREFPISLQLDLKNDKLKLKEIGYSSSDIDAKISSIYINRIFRQLKLTPLQILLWFMSIAMSVMITVFVVMGLKT